MKTCLKSIVYFLLLQLLSLTLSAEPTELREWHSKAGTTVEAKALRAADGKIQLERADGTKIVVALDTFTDEDHAILREHFQLGDDTAPGAEAPPEGEAADDLPHPLGVTTGELTCGSFHYFLYFPKSLRKGAEHPVVFVMNPVGGGASTAQRYTRGAERNRWIIAVSKESKNGFNASQDAIDAMIEEVTSTLPIDEDRMYTSGMSGGTRMALATARKHDEIAGVIACGAGGELGSNKQVAYGLCGSNCYNRIDMSKSFENYRSKDCILRFFPGRHDWAGAELIDDATTHLNGVFLLKNQKKYPEEFTHYHHEVSKLIEESKANSPLRALMWTTFLNDREILPEALIATHQALAADPSNELYVKGLKDVQDFAIDQFSDEPTAEWKIAPNVSAAFTAEAGKYAGTPWQKVLELMSKDAQQW